MRKNSTLFALAFALLVLVGCGNKVKLQGKVTFSDDGNPVPCGFVCFETDTYSARGDIQPDGTFDVGSLGPKDGLPPGKYRVSISGAERVIGETPGSMGRTIKRYESLIDTKYENGNTSGLTIDVDASTKKFEFQVDRYQK